MTELLFFIMLIVSPPERWNAYPGYEETELERRARYASIAADVSAVAANATITGSAIGDAAVLLGVTWAESGWFLDVDKGPCAKVDTRCDSGRSACMAQVRLGKSKTTKSAHGVAGLTQADLFADRQKCLGVAAHALRRSFNACTKLGPEHRMDVYASGKCGYGTTASEPHRRAMEWIAQLLRKETSK